MGYANMTRIDVIEGTFKNQNVNLDGHNWTRCKFMSCNIIIEYGDYSVIGCHFNDCKLSAKGNAIGILKIAKLFFPSIPLIESDKPV